ncbi:nucleotidyltransferase family protein [Paenibacillus alginolyticus]|uniref:nucleotidyltransferase family protein n=1 Tax=Paenibacillus alginolyticus TaxID=59839 RepID=UPI000411EA04|nr:nucleotidyltransferase family protein [Paenibacillus alginolyticus]MCY9664837.1 nucleotidyltransferase family protein [Paenibacillus alginolyticus]
MEAIVLAGGFGTRLRSVVSNVPKPMAPVGGIPFLCYILDYLKKFGISRVVLSTGYKHEIIEDYFGKAYRGIELVYSVENEPLGTGGAIRVALEKVKSNEVFVLNGDTFFQVDLHKMREFQTSKNADLSISLKLMNHFDRYGTVEVSLDRIIAFHEKKITAAGMINGGIYLLKSNLFNNIVLPDKFSFESQFLQLYLNKLQFYGYLSEGYFIDIGVPEDYMRAQKEIGEFFE